MTLLQIRSIFLEVSPYLRAYVCLSYCHAINVRDTAAYIHLFGTGAELELVRPRLAVLYQQCFTSKSWHVACWRQLRQPELQVKRISEFELRHKTALEKLPHWVQEAYSRRQKQASSVPGTPVSLQTQDSKSRAVISAAAAGSEKWVFPRPIYDESSFRERAYQEM